MNDSNFYKWFKASIPWMLVVVGIIIFTFTEFYAFFTSKADLTTTFEKNWLQWLGGIGKAILISGISSVIINSFEFMGIFKGAMVEIVMGDAYLSNRKDLAKHWEKVTLMLFKNRFEDIHDEITKDIKEKYLPIETEKYYDKATEDITIKLINKQKQIIEVTSTTTFTINTWDAKQDLKHHFVNDIVTENQNSSTEKFEVVQFQIDGIDVQTTGARNVKEFIDEKWRLVNTVEVIGKMTGKLSYDVNYTLKKTYCLHYDNLLYNLFQHIYNGVDVYFHLDGVDISIVKIGTVKNFQKLNRTNRYLHLKYKGLIYPQQGYIAVIKKI